MAKQIEKHGSKTIQHRAQDSQEAIEFSPYALTYLEQLILRKLVYSQYAQNAWQIYRRVVGTLVVAASPDEERDRLIEYQKKTGDKAQSVMIEVELPDPELPKDKKEFGKIISDLKKKGRDIPNYAKVTRILDDMVVAGWIKKRTEGVGKATGGLYYIEDPYRKKIEQSMKERF